MPGGSKDSPKRRYPKRSTRSQHPRSSTRLKVKGLREFVLPDKAEVLANLVPEGTSSKNYRHLRPRKLINEYVKGRNSYNNPDGIDLFDDDTLADFIDDDNDTVKKTKRKQKRKSSGSEWEEDSDDGEYSDGSAVSESDDVLADDAKSEISIYSESVVEEPDIDVLSSEKVEESDSDVLSDSSTEEFLANRIKKSLRKLPKRVTSSTWWKTNKDPVSACKKRRRPLKRTPVVESDDDSEEENESSPTKHKQKRRITVSDDEDDDSERPSGSGIRTDSPKEHLDKYFSKSNRNINKHMSISKNKIIPPKHDNDVNKRERRLTLDPKQSKSSEDEKTLSNIQNHNNISSSDDTNQTEDQTSDQQNNLDNGTISRKAFAASSRKRIRTNELFSCEESDSEHISQSSEGKQESDLDKEKDICLSDSEVQCPKSAKRNRKVLIYDDDDDDDDEEEQKHEEHISQEVLLELNTSDDQGYNVNSVQSSNTTFGKELTITDSGLMQQEKTSNVHLPPHEAVEKNKDIEIAIANDRQNNESGVTSHTVIISNNEHIDGNEFDNKEPRCSISNNSNKSNVQTEFAEVESIIEKKNNNDTEHGNNEINQMGKGDDRVQTEQQSTGQQSAADEKDKDSVCSGISKDSESDVNDAERVQDRRGSNETNVGNALNELNESNANNKADVVLSDANASIKEEEKLVPKALDYDSDDSVIECEAPPKSPIPEITLSSDEDEHLPPSNFNASNVKVTSIGQQHSFPMQNVYNSMSSGGGGFNTAFSNGRSFSGNLFGQHLSSESFTFASNAGNNHSQTNTQRSVTGFGNQATNIPNYSATSQFGNRMQTSGVFNNADVRTVFSTASINASAANLQSQNQAEMCFRSWSQVTPNAHNYQSSNRIQTTGGNTQYQSFANAHTMNRLSMSGISSDNITNHSNVQSVSRLPCESTQYQSFTGPGNQNRAQSTNFNNGPQFQHNLNRSPVLECQTGENVTVSNCQPKSRFKENYALLRNLLKTDTTLNRQFMNISSNNGIRAQQFRTPARLQTSVPTGTAAATSAANFGAVNNSCQRTGNYGQLSSFSSADHVVPTSNRINVVYNYQTNSYGMSANNIHQPSTQSSACVGGIITGSNGRVLNYQAENRPDARGNNMPFQSMSSISNSVSVGGTHPYSSSNLFSNRTPILNNYQTQNIPKMNRRSPSSTDMVGSVVYSRSQVVNQFQRPANVQIQTRPNASSMPSAIGAKGDSSNFQSVNRFSLPGNSVQAQATSALLPPSTGMLGSAKISQLAVNSISNNSIQPQSLLNATVVGTSNSVSNNQSLNRLEMFSNHINPETPSEVQVSTANRVQPQTVSVMGTTSTGMLVSAQCPQSLNVFQMSGNSIVQPQTIPAMLPTSTGMLSSPQNSQSVKRFQNADGSVKTQTLPVMGLTPTGVLGSAQSPNKFHPQTTSALRPASSDMTGSALNSQSVNRQMVDNSVQPQSLPGIGCTPTGNMGSTKNYQPVNRLQISGNSVQSPSFQNTVAGLVNSDSNHQALNRLEMFTKNLRPQTQSEIQVTVTSASNNTSSNRFTPSLPDSIVCQNVETAVPGGLFASALNNLAQNIFQTSVGSSGQKQNILKSNLVSPVASSETNRFIKNGNNEQQQTEPIVMPFNFEAYQPVKNFETQDCSRQLQPLPSAPQGSKKSFAPEAIAITPILNSASCHDGFIQQDTSSVTIGNQSYAHASDVPEETTNTIYGLSHFTLESNSSTVNQEISPELKQTKHLPRHFKPNDIDENLSGCDCSSGDQLVNDIETDVSAISQTTKKPVVILCDILSRIKSVNFDEARGTPREGTRNIRMNVKPGEKFLIKENNDNSEHDIIALNMNTNTAIESIKECLNGVETCRSKSQTTHDGIRDGDTTHSVVMTTGSDIENSKTSFNSSQLSTFIANSCSPEQVNGHFEFVTDQSTRKAREEDRNLYKNSSRETSNETISYRADRFNRILRSRSNSPIASDNNNERNSTLPKSHLGSSNQKNKVLEILPVL